MDLSSAFEGLNDRERIFVEGILRGMSQVASATAAGYKAPTDSSQDLLKKPRIIAAIEKGRELSIQATGITREKLSDMLMSAYMGASTAAEQVMAVRELGKLHGLYAAQKVEVGHTHKLEAKDAVKQLQSMSSEQLLKLARMNQGKIIDGEFTEVRLPALIEHGKEETASS